MHKNRKQPVGKVILEILAATPTAPFTNQELYKATCNNLNVRISSRDFQDALDNLVREELILAEDDPQDRRRKRITIAPVKPFTEEDFEATLSWKMSEALYKVFDEEPWLMPVEIFPVTDEWLKSRPPTSELVELYPYWQKYTEEEAKEVISIGRVTFAQIQRKFTREQDLYSAAGKLLDAMTEANVEEIIDAWIERRAIDRKNILGELRKRLVALTKELTA
jgi:hypothetical protein